MTTMELNNKVLELWDSWSEETRCLVDEIWNRMAMAETDCTVFEERIKKTWTKDLHLYTQEEVNELLAPLNQKKERKAHANRICEALEKPDAQNS